MSDPGEQRQEPPPPTPSPMRRQRAPTITIDTSAVSPSIAPPPTSSRPSSSSSNRSPQHTSRPSLSRKLSSGDAQDEGSSPVGYSPIDIQPKDRHSFELKDSRPSSPHNVSSPPPPQKWGNAPTNYLSVPITRSRGNSVDSEEMAVSPSSYGGETYLPSASEASQSGDAKSRLDTARSNEPLLYDNDGDALKPVPGSEDDFHVDNNKFAFSPGQLGKLFPKSLAAFYALGGLPGLEKGLRTDRNAGLSVDEKTLDGRISFDEAVGARKSTDGQEVEPGIKHADTSDSSMHDQDAYCDRRRVFGDNILPEKKPKSIWALMWLAYNDKVLILLTAAAIISLALGIYQSVTADDQVDKLDWIEGVAIVVAIIIVVLVGAANDWQKERQFVKLNKKKEERNVKVVRSGKSREISVHDVVAGDVVHLEPGDLIPVDGILVSGHGIKCDESSETGESDLAKKLPADEALAEMEKNGADWHKIDPFLISGSKVQEGVGTFLVTGVGAQSSHGKIMMSLHEESQTTPLQSKLNVLAEWIAKLGLAAGLLLFTVTFIQFLARLGSIPGGPEEKGQAFLQVFIVAVTVIVVAVPEGLPLAVTLALAFATTRMMKDNNLVRLLKACETMGNATTICSDKTGTLTQNKMTVVAATLGTKVSPSAKYEGNNNNDAATKTIETESGLDPVDGKPHMPSSYGNNNRSIGEVMSDSSKAAKELLKEAVLVNSTAFEGHVDGTNGFVGSKTEAALLILARESLGMGPLDEERSNRQVVQVEPFDSKRKCMATAVKVGNGRYRVYVKGASELMLKRCTRIVQEEQNSDKLADVELTADRDEALQQVIDRYAEKSLRTLGIAYRDFESQNWPPKGYPLKEDDHSSLDFDKTFKGYTFLAIVGIQDPLREGVPESVKICQNAGVQVRMVTGDNMLTAKAIATDAGIYTEGGLVLEGPKFRQMSKRDQLEAIPRLQVLARSSPEDKKILAKRLIDMGETVAVTGDGTNDVPALKTADVGFAMGIAGTEVAKEASDIILLDDNFNSIVKAMMWGRAVNDAVKKFLQFQVTVNITAVLLTFISAVGDPHQQSVLNAVQLLWVNLIMDTFAALALATDPPSRTVLDRKPERKNAPLISFTMWKMIIGQSVYQLIVTLVLNYAGTHLGLIGSQEAGSPANSENASPRQLQTLVFNSFVWMQIFNQYNSRRLDNKLNIFEGALRNYWFLGIQCIICGCQVLIIFVGGDAFKVEPLVWQNWVISIVIGFISLPVAVLLRLFPERWIRKVTDPIGRMLPGWVKRRFNKRNQHPEVTVEDEEAGHRGHPDNYEWNPAIAGIRDELMFIKRLRGGRLSRIKYDITHPREVIARSRSQSRSRSRANSNLSSAALSTPNNEPSEGIDSSKPTPGTSPMRSRRGSRRSRSNSAFGPAAAMAGVVAGSIGGWSPVELREGEGRSRRPSTTGEVDDSSKPGTVVDAPGSRKHKNSGASTLAPPPSTSTGAIGSGRSSRSNSNNALAPPPFEHV